MSQQSSIAELLRQTEHYDKDERYMATSDLNEILIRHAAANNSVTTNSNASNYNSQLIDTATEKQICSAILKLLDDSSNDVQAIAVKTLGVLLKTVHEEQVVEIADRLGSLVYDSTKCELRDVYAIGLRTLVKEVQVGGDLVAHRLTNCLIEGIKQNSPSMISNSANTDKASVAKSQDITLACLDVLTDLLPRFGSLPLVTRQHEQLLKVILQQLASESQLVCKRAGNTIACLSAVISDQLLQRLVESLLSQIGQQEEMGGDSQHRSKRIRSHGSQESLSDDNDFKASDTRSLIHTMCGVSGIVGHRLGQEQIDRVIPILLKFCKPSGALAGDDDDIEDDEEMEDEDEAMEDDEAISMANELRESCFTGFQSFILRCPTQIQPHLNQIIHSSLAYIRYDPNYSYGDENEDNDMDEDADDEDDYSMDEEEEDDYEEESDDDDDSWKVRRSAIKTLAAAVETFKNDVTKLWIDEFGWKKNTEKVSVASGLVKRFKEREENCRVDIIECFTSLLSNTISIASTGKVVLSSPDTMDTTSGDSSQILIDFSKYVPSIVSACEKQLGAKKGGTRTKGAALALLSALCSAPGGIGGSDQIASICKHVKLLLQGDASNDTNDGSSKSLKLNALHFTRVIVTSSQHNPAEISGALLEYLFDELCATVKEVWYKITAESLRLLAEVSRLLHSTSSVNEKVAKSLYGAVEPRLAANDLDQEIKECALTASGSIICTLRENLTEEERTRLLSLILLRLKNETTRLVAMKTISAIAGSDEYKVDLSPILADAVLELSSLLRQSNRGVKYHSLQSLNILIRNHGGKNAGILNENILGGVLKELSGLVADEDVHISHLSLQLSLTVIEVCPSCNAVIQNNLLPSLLIQSTSPSINDSALGSLLSVFEKLIVIGAVQFQEILKTLQSKLDAAASRQSIGNLGKCIAAITAVASETERSEVISSILVTLESADGNLDSSIVHLALRTTGALGYRIDLSAYENAGSRLLQTYLKCFDSQSEDVKNAAAYALGNAAVKATPVFLPGLLSALEQSDQKKQYLLLSALREFIHCYHNEAESTFDTSSIEQIKPHLRAHCTAEEESVRTKVADCMGGLTCLQPTILLPQLKTLVLESIGKSSNDVSSTKNYALTCWTVATSIKFAIAGHCDSDILSPFMPTFLKLLKEDDLNVRNAALLMVYSAVHHSPKLIEKFMTEHVMPSLYEVAQLKQIREVDLGPFKHKLDDALPLRKTALSIFSTCLEKCAGRVDPSSLIPVLTRALSDVEDIQLQAHQMMISMGSIYSQEVVLAIEEFIAPLEKTLKKNFKSKTGAELERANEWVKSALRVMIALSEIGGAMNNRKFSDSVERAKNNPKLKGMLEDLDEES